MHIVTIDKHYSEIFSQDQLLISRRYDIMMKIYTVVALKFQVMAPTDFPVNTKALKTSVTL